jgi:hypothetical protein
MPMRPKPFNASIGTVKVRFTIRPPVRYAHYVGIQCHTVVPLCALRCSAAAGHMPLVQLSSYVTLKPDAELFSEIPASTCVSQRK